jgi:hypothetical protein
VDSLITTAARALAAGDPLGALNRVAVRDDAPAKALEAARATLAAAVTRGSHGPKGRSGWGNIGIERSIKLIPKPGRFFARSSRSALSRGHLRRRRALARDLGR